MAANPIPTAFPSLLVLSTQAFLGAEEHGAELPIVINDAAAIGADRTALIGAQEEYEAARSALTELSAERKAAVKAAYEFCFTVRDVIAFHLGRHYTNAWLAAGWLNNLQVPKDYAGLYTHCMKLAGYFEANPSQENAALGVTAAAAQAHVTALQSTNHAYNNAEADSLALKQTRDKKFKAMRKRLGDLCKELSMRLDDLDSRWRWFGFNIPGAPTVPAAPEAVTAFALPEARVQVACDPSPGATSYRFYVQRPVIDPAPVPVGSSTEPLFITDPLVAGTEYLIYVSASNEGAESGLSEPVTVVTRASAAA